jgi:signal transduction histidine kinase
VLDVEKLVDQASLDARSLTSELHSPALQGLDLEDAVRELARLVGTRYGIEIVVLDDGRAKHVGEREREILLRSIRELLINAAKHARAGRIGVRLGRGHGSFRAEVEDDGIGIQSDAAGHGGFGLTSIRECLRQVEGMMHIESSPERGTKISLWTPLSKEHTTRARVAR